MAEAEAGFEEVAEGLEAYVLHMTPLVHQTLLLEVVQLKNNICCLNTNLTVTVGAGGSGGIYTQNGTNGGNSRFGTVGAEIISLGGGGGSYYGTVNASAGGSCGGSAGYQGTTGTPGAGEPNQGFAGGQGFNGSTQSGGGGGGAGAVGQAGGGAATSGDGGDGVKTLILSYTNAAHSKLMWVNK